MEKNDLENKDFKIINNEKNIFIILQHFNFKLDSKDERLNKIKEEKKNKNKKVTVIVDVNDLSRKIQYDNLHNFIEIISKIKNEVDKNTRICEDNNINIIFKNTLINAESSLYEKGETLFLNMLYISDEMNFLGQKLSILFSAFKPKILILKKIKINSKLQLANFLSFIIDSKCEDLFLEDIFIELIIKKDENDESYNILSQYFSFEDGTISIKNEKISKSPIIKLKMK